MGTPLKLHTHFIPTGSQNVLDGDIFFIATQIPWWLLMCVAFSFLLVYFYFCSFLLPLPWTYFLLRPHTIMKTERTREVNDEFCPTTTSYSLLFPSSPLKNVPFSDWGSLSLILFRFLSISAFVLWRNTHLSTQNAGKTLEQLMQQILLLQLLEKSNRYYH